MPLQVVPSPILGFQSCCLCTKALSQFPSVVRPSLMLPACLAPSLFTTPVAPHLKALEGLAIISFFCPRL